MISFVIAKKLKDLGFPFKYAVDGRQFVNGYQFEDGSVAHIPILSELIEACGENFGYLTRMPGGVFTAYPVPEKLKERKEWYLCRGASDEAVANLYLEINKDGKV